MNNYIMHEMCVLQEDMFASQVSQHCGVSFAPQVS